MAETAEAAPPTRNVPVAPLKSYARIIEFHLGKGITRKIAGSEADFNKKYIEFTVRLPEGCSEEQLHEAMLRTEYIADDFLAQAETHIPDLDIAEINNLPWKKRNREPAKPNEFGWLFGPGARDGTEQGAEKLVNSIKATKDGKLVLGDMEYSLVKNEAFVQRRPIKVT